MSIDTRRIDAALSNSVVQKLLRDLEAAHATDRPALLREARELCSQLLLTKEDYDALLVGWAKAFGLRAETASRRSLLLAEAMAEAKAASRANNEPSLI